ncbi:uncharacterized protein LOC143258500 [Tachypleus tridentatus]|uniref:uncharacterized protein LOC143258500 n=1 Tax=Tachypleus tridentatus TaxID=6853 RepID=UPI003FD49309
MNERFKTQGFVLQSFPNDISEVEYMFQEAWYPDLILYLKTDLKLIARQRLPNRLEEWKNRRDKKKSEQDQERKNFIGKSQVFASCWVQNTELPSLLVLCPGFCWKSSYSIPKHHTCKI